jgi:uncharacterized protein (DUF1015 family)
MADIRPFLGIRYDTHRFGRDISALLAPPYDVLDASDKEALLAAGMENIVAVDLPHVPPKQAGPEEVYADAAARLEAWREDGVVVSERAPALYRYHQTFQHDGRQITRRMLIARLRLEPFGTGRVFPHEQTFPGAKADRLKLMQATRCNLSAVFGLYSDADGVVSHLLTGFPGPADATGMLDGVLNEIWVVSNTGLQAQVTAAMADKNFYIADGHHRYETALTYRDELADELGSLPDEHPANYLMVVLCAMEDPGLLILPTHRVVATPGGFDAAAFAEQIAERFETLLVTDPPQAAPFAASLSKYGRAAIGLYDGSTAKYCVLKPRGDDVLESLAPDKPAAWRRLDVAALHRYLITEVLSPHHLGGADPKIRYLKDAAGAVDLAASEQHAVAFLLQPIDLADLRAVCEAGEVMPQKSTFFAPKLATGLVINPLED